MPRPTKDQLGSPPKPQDAEKEAFKEARRGKWATVHAHLEAGDISAARQAIADLQKHAADRYRAENGEV